MKTAKRKKGTVEGRRSRQLRSERLRVERRLIAREYEAKHGRPMRGTWGVEWGA